MEILTILFMLKQMKVFSPLFFSPKVVRTFFEIQVFLTVKEKLISQSCGKQTGSIIHERIQAVLRLRDTIGSLDYWKKRGWYIFC